LNYNDYMKYIALYRKYRPQVFEDVVEQGTVVKILQEALKQKKIAHAYLFAGPKGTGKTSIARIFAKGLNCENGPTPVPCMKCEQCITITNGTNLDVIEIDAASNRGIDEIRDLKEKVQYAPVSARYKVYIIDEAHMLTMQAFNALLKTLEEPPENVVFILATTEPEKIPATIISRCERFYFKPISTKGLINKIKEIAQKENAKITDSAALLIARFATGSLRNALSLLDQAITMFSEINEENIRNLIGIPQDELLKEFLDGIIRKDPKKSLSVIKNIEESGKDSKIFVNEFLSYLQSLLNGKIMGFTAENVDREPSFIDTLREQAKYISVKKIIEISMEFANLINIIRFFPNPFFPIQLATLKCMELESISEPDINNKKLEKKEPEKTLLLEFFSPASMLLD
jgi:DNA polymerase-3 subunit gamma/tau